LKVILRTLREFEFDHVCKHLLVVGELKGDCFNCREVGIDYNSAKVCPKCSNEFHYISCRSQSSTLNSRIINLHKKRPDLSYIEFDDVRKQKGKKQAKDFFFK